MRRVVLDSNVWIAAIVFPGGVCDLLLQQLRRRAILLFVSSAILEEVNKVLRRTFDFTTAEVKVALDEIRLMAHVVEPSIRVTMVQSDESDNRILECAIAAHADLIITGDTKDLLPLRHFQGIPIHSPRIALEQLR